MYNFANISAIFHSGNIAELMGEEPPVDLPEALQQTGISAEDLSGLSLTDATALLAEHGVDADAQQLRELL